GIDSVSPMLLGMAARIQGGTGAGTGFAEVGIGGYINSILNGGANDLGPNPGNATEIVDSAITDITDLRSFLGAFESRIVESNLNSLDVAFENIVSSESEVRDVDFARESAEFTRAAIKAQAATSVFGSSNIISVNVLSLLQ
ncbi:MAG: flagellin, partial [Planctomycetota bacterium]